jgi:hypothetical protein
MDEAPGPRLARNQELQRQISTLLLDPAKKKAYEQNPMTHAEISILRDLVQRTDQAMQAESIGKEVRDRVVHRLIFGEPPERPEPLDGLTLEQRRQTWSLRLQAPEKLPATELEKP